MAKLPLPPPSIPAAAVEVFASFWKADQASAASAPTIKIATRAMPTAAPSPNPVLSDGAPVPDAPAIPGATVLELVLVLVLVELLVLVDVELEVEVEVELLVLVLELVLLVVAKSSRYFSST